MSDHETTIEMPPSFNKLATERGFHYAYAFWVPTAEDKEAEAEAFRELGRKMAEARDAAIMEAVFGEKGTAE